MKAEARGRPGQSRAAPGTGAWELACPLCRQALAAVGPDRRSCPADRSEYPRQDGIWRLLRPGRQEALARFIREYETVRLAEGRASDDPAYYRALPFPAPGAPLAAMWAVRALSFNCLIRRVVAPLPPGRRVLDLGAGNGWLAYQLTRRGHHVAAVDLTVNDFDGLGARRHYDQPFTAIQAEFDALPFLPGRADVILFNASLHYSEDYETTLAEALQILRPDGRLVILDTPVYRDPASGAQMVAERRARFEADYGFAANALASEAYLTFRRLDDLSRRLRLDVTLYWPVPRWRRGLRHLKTTLRRQREAASFPIVVARKR